MTPVRKPGSISWNKLSGEAAETDPFEEADSVTVWLIPTTDDRRRGHAA
jgi:hypothetical protein